MGIIRVYTYSYIYIYTHIWLYEYTYIYIYIYWIMVTCMYPCSHISIWTFNQWISGYLIAYSKDNTNILARTWGDRDQIWPAFCILPYGYMDILLYGYMAIRIYGYMALWPYGCIPATPPPSIPPLQLHHSTPPSSEYDQSPLPVSTIRVMYGMDSTWGQHALWVYMRVRCCSSAPSSMLVLCQAHLVGHMGHVSTNLQILMISLCFA